MSCKRNAFMMLIHADQERALSFLSGCMDQVIDFISVNLSLFKEPMFDF